MFNNRRNSAALNMLIYKRPIIPGRCRLNLNDFPAVNAINISNYRISTSVICTYLQNEYFHVTRRGTAWRGKSRKFHGLRIGVEGCKQTQRYGKHVAHVTTRRIRHSNVDMECEDESGRQRTREALCTARGNPGWPESCRYNASRFCRLSSLRIHPAGFNWMDTIARCLIN